MPTKQTDTQTNQFSPQGMSAYNQMTPAMGQAATGYIQNPFSNPFFQQQQQMGTRQAQGLGGTQMGNIQGNMRASGIGGGGAAPFQQEMMANQGRANSGLQAQLGFMNPVSNALQMQQGAMGLASGYNPLQTGRTQTQQTSGVGTWLPQLAGGAMGAMMPGGGLLGSMMGKAMGGGGAGAGPGGMPSWGMGGMRPNSPSSSWFNGPQQSNPFGGFGQMQQPQMPQGPYLGMG